MTDESGEFAAFKDEAAPLLRHLAIAAILMAGLVAFAVALRAVEVRFPNLAPVIHTLEQIDALLIVALFTLYGAYTTGVVVLRLCASMRGELARTRRAVRKAAQGEKEA